MNNFFTECSYAKVNLGLKIVNQRPDKYHNISSIFIQINLHDKLYFIPNKKFKIESQGIEVPIDQKNIILVYWIFYIYWMGRFSMESNLYCR